MALRTDFINEDGVVDTLETDTHILGLFGKYRALSNFHIAPVTMTGRTFKCSEAAYMAEKTDNPEHKDYLTTLGPGEAKRFGQRVELVPNWDDIKYSKMLEVVRAKFTQNEHLARLLLSTGDKFIEEANWWGDTYWGTVNAAGKNCLGRILMQVRSELST